MGVSDCMLCEAFNAHDLDRIMAFFSDDCVLEMPRGSKPWGSRFEGKQNGLGYAAVRRPSLARLTKFSWNRDHQLLCVGNGGLEANQLSRKEAPVTLPLPSVLRFR